MLRLKQKRQWVDFPACFAFTRTAVRALRKLPLLLVKEGQWKRWEYYQHYYYCNVFTVHQPQKEDKDKIIAHEESLVVLTHLFILALREPNIKWKGQQNIAPSSLDASKLAWGNCFALCSITAVTLSCSIILIQSRLLVIAVFALWPYLRIYPHH